MRYKNNVVRKRLVNRYASLSIPTELAGKVVDVDFFKVDFDNGRLIYSPVVV